MAYASNTVFDQRKFPSDAAFDATDLHRQRRSLDNPPSIR